MDDLLIIMRRTLDEHLQKMETVLTRLHDAGLKVNAAKSLFCAHEIEYFGYILIRKGIKPQPKKVQAILMLNPPNTVKELRHFLGMVQYYRDMWVRRSEMLTPLTDLVAECRETKTTKLNKTKKKPWQWDSIHQQAFDNIKAAIAKKTVLAYPDFSKPFEIYMDTFRLDKSVPTTTLPPLVPRSTRLLRRNHSTLTKYNLLSSITIHRPPSSNRARQYQQNYIPTSG